MNSYVGIFPRAYTRVTIYPHASPSDLTTLLSAFGISPRLHLEALHSLRDHCLRILTSHQPVHFSRSSSTGHGCCSSFLLTTT